MMKRVAAAMVLLVVAFGLVGGAAAQERTAWIQIEADRTLREAQATIQSQAARLGDVAGFQLPGGWYAVALGPYTRDEARARLQQLKASGAIPSDSFLMFSSQYRRQFWPVGANALSGGAPAGQGAAASVPAPTTAPAEPEETPAQARASERALTADQRKALQIALQWEGFYSSGIDGAFGPGTRKAMAAWQAAQGLEPTGILTTRQRAQLLGDYQAAIDSLGLRRVADQGAGIEMVLPMNMVAFDRYEAPFAHYKSINDSGVRVVLISQSGDQNTLYGLYDIMQSLRIVPLNGERTRKAASFTITGSDDEIFSYTHATLVDGAVKGFTLIWPRGGDTRLRDMALARMRDSFASIPGVVLADDAGLDQQMQSVDLLSGLEIRRPSISRSGFYVAPGGAVLTTAEVAAGGCDRLSIDEVYDANLVAVDEEAGLALIAPQERLAPPSVAALLSGEARIGGEVAVAGYSFEGALSAPTMTMGRLADIRGLRGEETLERLEMAVQPGDAGGPVLNGAGAVIGMLLPRPDGGAQKLPDTVNFAVKSTVLGDFLAANGVAPTTSRGGPALDPVDLSAQATGMTVLVSCWN